MWTIGDALECSRGALLGVFHISHFEKARCGREEKGRGSGNTSQTLVYKVCFEARQDFLFPSWSAVCISCNSQYRSTCSSRPPQVYETSSPFPPCPSFPLDLFAHSDQFETFIWEPLPKSLSAATPPFLIMRLFQVFLLPCSRSHLLVKAL